MDVTPLINAVIAREGGYVNNSADSGGATNFGITQTVARAQGYAGNMRDLPRSEAVNIYTCLYWLKPCLNLIGDHSPKLAEKMFGIGVNMGPAIAIGFLKRALNVLNRNGVDYANISTAPLVDATTTNALMAFIAKRGSAAEGVLIKSINALQGERYISLAEARPADEAFVYGCLKNRIG